jgi:hypothetical protein
MPWREQRGNNGNIAGSLERNHQCPRWPPFPLAPVGPPVVPDKQWPLTDCISFVVMQREGLSEALTGDLHFEQASFVALLK